MSSPCKSVYLGIQNALNTSNRSRTKNIGFFKVIRSFYYAFDAYSHVWLSCHCKSEQCPRVESQLTNVYPSKVTTMLVLAIAIRLKSRRVLQCADLMYMRRLCTFGYRY
jgi:hypothetical protein